MSKNDSLVYVAALGLGALLLGKTLKENDTFQCAKNSPLKWIMGKCDEVAPDGGDSNYGNPLSGETYCAREGGIIRYLPWGDAFCDKTAQAAETGGDIVDTIKDVFNFNDNKTPIKDWLFGQDNFQQPYMKYDIWGNLIGGGVGINPTEGILPKVNIDIANLPLIGNNWYKDLWENDVAPTINSGGAVIGALSALIPFGSILAPLIGGITTSNPASGSSEQQYSPGVSIGPDPDMFTPVADIHAEVTAFYGNNNTPVIQVGNIGEWADLYPERFIPAYLDGQRVLGGYYDLQDEVVKVIEGGHSTLSDYFHLDFKNPFEGGESIDIPGNDPSQTWFNAPKMTCIRHHNDANGNYICDEVGYV